MSKGRPLVRPRAGSIALEVIDSILKAGVPCKATHAEITGSILRKEPLVQDIDIIAVNDDPEETRQRVGFTVEGVQVNVFITRTESLGAARLAYTGPKGYVIGWRKIAESQGFLLNQYGLYKDGKLVASRTEEEIATAIGKHVKAPELRGKK